MLSDCVTITSYAMTCMQLRKLALCRVL